MRAKLQDERVQAATEVVLVASIYIFISTTTVSAVDVSFLFPASWSFEERATGGGFLIGQRIREAVRPREGDGEQRGLTEKD